MAQEKDIVNNENNNNQKLCPFYGSSHGCPYLDKCELSHENPNSIELCLSYQSPQGCINPESCYYRHSLQPLSKPEINKLASKHKIAGKIQYTRVIKGKSVHRVIIIINQVLWYGIHFVIEDDRLQKIHYQKYSSVYYWKDAILISEFLANVLLKSECPGKYLSYLKNLIDGDTEPGNERKGRKNKNNKSQKLVHYRDILASIGNNYREIPKPINPHLVKNLSRVPWVDFKLLPLPFEVYDHPDIFLKPGDLVRIWRPKKFVYHCGVYLGNKRIIHISNGIQNDAGMSWRNSLFQSGSSAPSPPKYYDYGKKMRQQKQEKEEKENENENEAISNQDEGSDGSYDKVNAPDIAAVYADDDDMDLVNDDSDKEEENQHPEFKEDELIFENEYDTMYNNKPGEDCHDKDGNNENTFPPTKHSGLLYQDIDEFKGNDGDMNEKEQEYARRARECEWKEFLSGSRKKDLELGYFVFPWRKAEEIVYTAKFLTEIHYMKGQYSVVKNNCEHFSLYCCTGLRYSPQANTIENVMNVASKIGSFAGSIFSKVSFGRSNKDKDKEKKSKKEKKKEDKMDENRKNHPVLQSQELDDGGDDELEKILLNDGKDGNVLVFGDKDIKDKNKKDKKKKEKRDEYDISIDLNGNDNVNKKSVFIDEYANDEEDVLAQSIMLDQKEDMNNLADLSRMDSLENMTPGGLTMSEILVAKKHYNQQRQFHQDQQRWQV